MEAKSECAKLKKKKVHGRGDITYRYVCALGSNDYGTRFQSTQMFQESETAMKVGVNSIIKVIELLGRRGVRT